SHNGTRNVLPEQRAADKQALRRQKDPHHSLHKLTPAAESVPHVRRRKCRARIRGGAWCRRSQYPHPPQSPTLVCSIRETTVPPIASGYLVTPYANPLSSGQRAFRASSSIERRQPVSWLPGRREAPPRRCSPRRESGRSSRLRLRSTSAFGRRTRAPPSA